MGQEVVDKNKIFYSILHNDSQIKFEVTDDILFLGNFIGSHPQILRGIYKKYRKLELEYHHKPKIGAPIDVYFDYGEDGGDRTVTFKRQRVTVKFSEDDFLIFLAKVDAVYSEILPIGTVVELDEEMMPPVIKEQIKNSGIAELVVITGRKVPLQKPFDRYLVDYYAYLWPIGQLPVSVPITVSNMMISKVVHMGWQHPLDETFSMEVLRATQLAKEQNSTAFMPMDEGLEYFKTRATDSQILDLFGGEEES